MVFLFFRIAMLHSLLWPAMAFRTRHRGEVEKTGKAVTEVKTQEMPDTGDAEFLDLGQVVKGSHVKWTLPASQVMPQGLSGLEREGKTDGISNEFGKTLQRGDAGKYVRIIDAADQETPWAAPVYMKVTLVEEAFTGDAGPVDMKETEILLQETASAMMEVKTQEMSDKWGLPKDGDFIGLGQLGMGFHVKFTLPASQVMPQGLSSRREREGKTDSFSTQFDKTNQMGDEGYYVRIIDAEDQKTPWAAPIMMKVTYLEGDFTEGAWKKETEVLSSEQAREKKCKGLKGTYITDDTKAAFRSYDIKEGHIIEVMKKKGGSRNLKAKGELGECNIDSKTGDACRVSRMPYGSKHEWVQGGSYTMTVTICTDAEKIWVSETRGEYPFSFVLFTQS